jgi:hypothetical protein
LVFVILSAALKGQYDLWNGAIADNQSSADAAGFNCRPRNLLVKLATTAEPSLLERRFGALHEGKRGRSR